MGNMIGMAAKYLLGGIFGTQKRTERGTVLDEAKIIINGERQDQYGDPEDNFALIARLWSAVTGHIHQSGGCKRLVRGRTQRWAYCGVLFGKTKNRLRIPLALRGKKEVMSHA